MPATPETIAPPRWYAHGGNRPAHDRRALAAAPRLPHRVRRGVAAGAVRAVRHRFPAERAALCRNLARACPGRGAAWLDRPARRVFDNFGTCLPERSVAARSDQWFNFFDAWEGDGGGAAAG